MDTDAFASFVSLDVESLQPLLVIGLITDVQYANIPNAQESAVKGPGAELMRDNAPSFEQTDEGIRGAAQTHDLGIVAQSSTSAVHHVRRSLDVLKRAVQSWLAKGGVSFVCCLGNAVAMESIATGTQWNSLAKYDEARGRLGTTAWHHTLGEHDFRCFDSAQIASALMPCRTGVDLFYSFIACPGWRILILDAFDLSLLAHPPGSPAHLSTLAQLQANNPNALSAADPLEGLAGVDRRWNPNCGGIGERQLEWFSSQLAAADAAGPSLHHLTCHSKLLSPPAR